MPLNRNQLSLIHVGKAKLGLEDDDYRAILRQVAGVTSSRNLDAAGFNAVMARFNELGFKGTTTSRPASVRPGMASAAQVELIRGLWAEFTGTDCDDLALGRWLERTFHVSSIRFLTYDSARKAVGALKMMKARNFDRKPQDGGKRNSGTPSSRKGKRASNPVADTFNGDVPKEG